MFGTGLGLKLLVVASAIFAVLMPTALLARQGDAETLSMRECIERYQADRGSLRRSYDVPLSETGRSRLLTLDQSMLQQLQAADFDSLQEDAKIDYLLLQNYLVASQSRHEHERQRDAEVRALLPFVEPVLFLLEQKQRKEWLAPRAAAEQLAEIAELVAAARKLEHSEPSPLVANRAADRLDDLRRSLGDWHRYRDGYDPEFSWWTQAPFSDVDRQMRDYGDHLRQDLAGLRGTDDDPLLGDPIGRQALLSELKFEMIPYSPEELIEIANQEFAWCEKQMLVASQDLGFGDEWRQALDHVKNLHVAPGQQPILIRQLAEEAVEFLESRELVTIPSLCKETWRMRMMSPERQRTSPYFLGGETILISYPTDTMTHAEKLMSMRGNNIHFARATVQHELIPGHHLQGFMNNRYQVHRSLFRTPFWTEGWALYWEMRLWDLGFPRTAEDRVGMLFWRMHRCARIIFSLSFHMGTMSAEEAVTFLTEKVGHEERNARAEVRRSVAGNYGPLYQAAYMLGGLQFRALHQELVMTGEFTEREFHDAILQENSIPVALLRLLLSQQDIPQDLTPSWRFYDS